MSNEKYWISHEYYEQFRKSLKDLRNCPTDTDEDLKKYLKIAIKLSSDWEKAMGAIR